MNKPLWIPRGDQVKNSNIARFADSINKQYGTEYSFNESVVDYDSLQQWSVKNKKKFWESIWQFHDIIGDYNPNKILEKSELMPGCEWFNEATLNFAENLLQGKDDQAAIIARDETGKRIEIDYRELRDAVSKVAYKLKNLGVRKGDRVAGFVSNCSEAVIAMLATTSLGGVWSSCSPDFGINGVIDRFGQIQPKVLFATNGYYYGGKCFDAHEKIKNITANLSSLESTLLIDYLPHNTDILPNAQPFKAILDTDSKPLEFERVDFSDPLYIMYSSGTTGVPKCITHSVGGTLLQQIKEHSLHGDLSENERIFYYTTCGWMMWNWLVSALALKATIVLYEGSPFSPSPDSLWRMIDEESISIFGSSAKYYAACEKEGIKPAEICHLNTLNTLLSTGSPLAHESYDYIYRDVKSDVCLSSISGGTDIISCFCLGSNVLPVYRGELQCIGLGMDVAIYDDNGHELDNGKGELVCKTPFPSMPTGFWNDNNNNNEKYTAAYFSTFVNTWAHGDYGEIVSHNTTGLAKQRGMVIHGRSDAVLNPGGVRIGTAEIYRQVEKIDEVLESIAVGQEWDQDVRVILFVKLKTGISLDDDIISRIKKTIRSNTTPRHVPIKILSVEDIPRTISGKIVELAVRNVIHNIEVKNKDALANPEALDYFANRKELQT